MKTCSVEECNKATRSKGSLMCEMHYYRLRRNNSLKVRELNDYFLLNQKDGINIYKIVEVSCHGNPKDLYEISKYISVGVVESDNDLNIDFLNSLDLSNRTIFNM